MDILASKLGIEKSELTQALTHLSFYENKDESKANSRLVFAGMYIFKGLVADILLKYYAGLGTQIQQVLGNLFKNDYLNRLFDTWGLSTKVRAGENFDIKKHKHIFVYAILGCISQSDKENQRRFIFKYIINKDTEHIFKHLTKNKDLISQTRFIAKQHFGKKLKTEMQLTAEQKHIAIIKFDDDTEISRAESKSYKYARKKAMKLALQILSKITFEQYALQTDYLQRVKQRIEQEKEQRRIEIEQRIVEKEAKRKERAEINKRIRKAKDLARRKAQAQAKKRKQEREALAAKKAREQENRPMNAGKRRFLEDKKK